MREKKTHFIIVRVTALEKEYILKTAVKAKRKLSTFIRSQLGLERCK